MSMTVKSALNLQWSAVRDAIETAQYFTILPILLIHFDSSFDKFSFLLLDV